MLYPVLCERGKWIFLLDVDTSLYLSIFLSLSKLWLGSIGVLAGLHTNFPICLRRFVTYSRREIKIPCLECATSIPKKHFNLPNSLISNSLVKHCLKVCLSSSSFLVMVLSTYTKRVVTPFEFECLINNVWSPWICLYPMFLITFANPLNLALGDCFRPYNVFFCLHTFLVVESLLNLDFHINLFF